MSETNRLYGNKPYTIVAVHGGPGGVGEARPFAEELAKDYVILFNLGVSDFRKPKA